MSDKNLNNEAHKWFKKLKSCLDNIPEDHCIRISLLCKGTANIELFDEQVYKQTDELVEDRLLQQDDWDSKQKAKFHCDHIFVDSESL